jgi:hypothetical protein
MFKIGGCRKQVTFLLKIENFYDKRLFYTLKGLIGYVSSNCDSNIGLFSIAPHLVLALPSLR